MGVTEGEKERLCTQWVGVRIARCWRTDDKSDVKPRLANLPNGVARSSFRNLQIDRRMQFTKLTQELGYKARQDWRIYTDAEPALLTACNRTLRPHSVIEVLHTGGNV